MDVGLVNGPSLEANQDELLPVTVYRFIPWSDPAGATAAPPAPPIPGPQLPAQKAPAPYSSLGPALDTGFPA